MTDWTYIEEVEMSFLTLISIMLQHSDPSKVLSCVQETSLLAKTFDISALFIFCYILCELLNSFANCYIN